VLRGPVCGFPDIFVDMPTAVAEIAADAVDNASRSQPVRASGSIGLARAALPAVTFFGRGHR
jgi:hypothetical protein